MLPNYYSKVKDWIGDNKADLYVAAVIFLVGLASFGLGRLSVLWPEKEPIRIDQVGEIGKSSASGGLDEVVQFHQASGASDPATSPNSAFAKGKYVASKNGSAYHFPWCPGAQRIKEENKIWFETKEAAQTAGYRPAANCEGL